MSDPIPFHKPDIDSDDRKALRDVLTSGWLTTGKEAAALEREFAESVGARCAVAVSSGTAALHVACVLAGFNHPTHEVIVPTLTFTSTASEVLHAGATPVLADVDAETFNLSVETVAARRTRKTVGVLPVHYTGSPQGLPAIVKDATEQSPRYTVIEDAAPAYLAAINGTRIGGPTGSFARCFSLRVTKNITCFPPKTRVVVRRQAFNGGDPSSKLIEEIKAGDEVLTFNEKTARKEFHPVLETSRRAYIGELITLTLSNGNEIEATPNHPFYLVGQRVWRPLDEVVVGDRLLQYQYQGLGVRCYGLAQRGQTKETLYGEERGRAIRQKVSAAVRGEKHPRFGRINSPEHRKKIGAGNKGKFVSAEIRKRLSESGLVKYKDKAYYDEHIRKMQVFAHSPAARLKRGETQRRKWLEDPEYRAKILGSLARARQDPEAVRRYVAGLNLRPNRAEASLNKILDTVCPGEFVYNGDFSQNVVLDSLIPDFVHTNGKKKLIELFGGHWHKPEEEQSRRERFAQHGFDCLIVWEKELRYTAVLEAKIEAFLHNPGTEVVTVTAIRRRPYRGEVFNLSVDQNHNYFAQGVLVHNCVEGGMLTFDDIQLERPARRYAYHGINPDTRPPGVTEVVVDIGWKYNLPDLLAALGRSQLRKADVLAGRRQTIADRYRMQFSSLVDAGLLRVPRVDPAVTSSWQLYIVRFALERLKPEWTRDRLARVLRERGIGTSLQTLQRPLHTHPFWRERAASAKWGEFPVADKIALSALCLPIWPGLAEAQVDQVADEVSRLVKAAVR